MAIDKLLKKWYSNRKIIEYDLVAVAIGIIKVHPNRENASVKNLFNFVCHCRNDSGSVG